MIARLAALRGATAAERAALERRVELEPGDTAAWDRLAELAARDGSADRAAHYRRRKAEIDRARDQYRMLMEQSAAGGRPREAELARIAEDLGRRFEARGWWTIRARQNLDDREARAALDRLARAEPSAATGRTLADLIPGSLSSPPRRALPPASRRHLIAPAFRDDAQAAGLRFVYENDPTPLCRLPETMGGGVGLLDYDGDGWLDVYAVQGGSARDKSIRSRRRSGDRLFRNRGDGTFEDVTERAGSGRDAGRLRPRRGGGRLRQRRPARPVRHALAVLRALPQPGRRHLRGRDRARRPGRRPRLADLGGLRRPRRRRRPRPLRLPLYRLGP